MRERKKPIGYNGEMTEPKIIKLKLESDFPAVNVWLIEGKELSIIDTGLGLKDSNKLFVEALANYGYTVSDIKNVYLTHEHFDHIGGLAFLIKESEAKIWCHESLVDRLKDHDVAHARDVAFGEAFLSVHGISEDLVSVHFLKHQGGHHNIKVPVDRMVHFKTGDSLAVNGYSFEVIHTPGHCFTHYSFYDRNEGILFGGDLILPKAPFPTLAKDPQNLKVRFKGLPSFIKSLQEVKALNLKRVYPGHGDTIIEVNELIDRQIGRILNRKDECFELIASGLDSIVDLGKRMFRPRNVAYRNGGYLMIRGYLDLLKEEDKIISKKTKEGHLRFLPKRKN